jgi:hypothetical protein
MIRDLENASIRMADGCRLEARAGTDIVCRREWKASIPRIDV